VELKKGFARKAVQVLKIINKKDEKWIYEDEPARWQP
jgi:hypothetical protein